MKKNNFIGIFLVVSIISVMHAEEPAILKLDPLASITPVTPQCYCSELCGPRDVKEGDTPQIDPETGICFCQQWDKENYVPQGCNIKDPNPIIPNSYCGTIKY